MTVSIKSMLAVAATALLITATRSFGTDDFHERDGKWWLSRNAMQKAVYTLGMMDGVYTGGNMLIKKDPRTMAEWDTDQKRLFGQVNCKQLVDGMDSFYKNFKNRNIPTSTTLWFVAWQIAGATDEQLEPMIIVARKASGLSVP